MLQMSEKRNYAGRLDMDIVRGMGAPPLVRAGPGHGSRNYTEEWLRGVEVPETAHSLGPLRQGEPTAAGDEQQRVARSAPALSIRSGASNRSSVMRTKLELELKHLKEKQNLDKEQREIELEIQRQELEQQKRLAELKDKRRMHELESRLAEARLQEELEEDGNLDMGLNYGGEIQDLSHACVDPQTVIGDGVNDNQRPREDGVDAPGPTVVHSGQKIPNLSAGTARQSFNLEGRQPLVFIPQQHRPQPSQPDRGPQFPSHASYQEPAIFARQMFENQQQALSMMANTIGTTISKGFEMPRREYLTFDGNPLTYPSFMESFKTNVEDIESSASARRNFLIQLCSGEAKDAISGTIMLPPEEGFQRAKSILHEMFGQTHIIAASHIDKVITGGAIKENENEKLMQLARDMENCEMNLNSLGFQADINSRSNMSAVVLRLPRYLRSEWAKEAQNSRDKGEEPNFAQLTKFVVKKAKLANTEYGRLICARPNADRENIRKTRFGSKHVSAYLSRGSEEAERPEDNRRSPIRSTKPKCVFCDKDGHTVERCFKFQEKTFEERKTFVSKKGLCHLCLSRGHFSSNCKKSRGCLVPGCGKRHHPLVHPSARVDETEKKLPKGQNEERKPESSTAVGESTAPATKAHLGHCGASGTIKNKVCLRVVPVKVFTKDDGRRKITYAIRDEGSNTTLVKQSLMDELNSKGQPIDFTLTTMNKVSLESGRSHSLYIQGLCQKNYLEVPNALSVKSLAVARSCIPDKEDIAKWRHLDGISFPELDDKEVTILIGTDVPEAHWKLEERRGRKKEPYAIRTPLGWSVAGPMGGTSDNEVNSFFVQSQDDVLREKVTKMFELDFSESTCCQGEAMSIEDKKAVTIMTESLEVVENHYQLDLPLRDRRSFPNNKSQAERRLNSLKARLKKDMDLGLKYKEGIEDYVKKGYARKVETADPTGAKQESGQVWYLPHHPVIHPQKPNKPRIVFDCAAKFDGVSLNQRLLQGPDMTNSLVGVLLRFREDPVAFLGDIEAMFCQVRASPRCRSLLRFLWFKDGDYDKPMEEYEMQVHLFGAKSSPSCAGFCLRKVAEEFEMELDPETIDTIRKNFYVDDCVKSVVDAQIAIRLIQELCEVLSRRSFRLTKFVSNSKEVLTSVPESERAPSICSLDLDDLPTERALGTQWNVQEDTFEFRIISRACTPTRRGILSHISSLYDPLGFASPFVLPAKRILQQLCKDKVQWDEEVPSDVLQPWERWLNDLPKLARISIPRCLKPTPPGQLKDVQLHHFADASTDGYGAVSYLRITDVEGQIQCNLVMGKSRVAPIRPTTIPRLELTAATLAVKQDHQIQKELSMKIDSAWFWTDSTCVLQYINNEASRFKTFVANRIAIIHDHSKPSQWRYVNTKANPADSASRGLRPNDEQEIDRWINGPTFLREDESSWPSRPEGVNVLPDETLEWKRDVEIYGTQSREEDPLQSFIRRYSSWYRLLKGTAWLIRFTHFVQSQHGKIPRKSIQFAVDAKQPLSVGELQTAKTRLVRYVQHVAFPEEVECLKPKKDHGIQHTVKKSSKLSALSPFTDDDGVIRVGGRLDRATISFDAKHPAILPSKHHIVDLLIHHFHVQVGHSGVRTVLTAVQREYWILRGRSRIRWIVNKCIHCRKRFALPCEQIMAPLPTVRVTTPDHPFAATGVDYFGPLMVKRGRSMVKRYGCVFTCMATRATHIEVAHSLDAESFLCAFSRFTARRGLPTTMFSDNGSNFIGASRILKEDFEKIRSDEAQSKIYDRLRMKGVTWHFNPPFASHTGGVWERVIRSIRKILMALMTEQTVDDETLLTLLVEVERILNDRPLVRGEGQVDDLDPLTPSKLLLLRTNSCLPPGVFVDADRFTRRWRQAQVLANSFWKRWISEYLPTLQERQKWREPRRNVQVNDLVMLVDSSCPRGQWPMAIVEEVFPDEKGTVRHVIVRTGSGKFKRDVRKLCMLEEAN